MGEPNLRDIWERQLGFNRRFFRDSRLAIGKFSAAETATWTKEFVLSIENELHELLRQTSWKMHRRSDASATVRSNVLEEWVDAFKFLLGLAQVWGFELPELVEEFERKSSVVEHRWEMERRLSAIAPDAPVVAVDLDGVLNDYPWTFCRYATNELRGVVGEDEPLSRAELRAELGPRGYLEMKDRYRESGEKRFERVRDGATELLDGLRIAGLTIVLLSRRPYWRFSRIYADTLEWLRTNDLRVDAILFHPEKHRKILEDFQGIVAVVEDDPVIAREILEVGTPVILVAGELNDGIEVEGARFASSPDAALRFIPGGTRL